MYLGLSVEDTYIKQLSKPRSLNFTQSEIDAFVDKISLDLTKEHIVFNDYIDSHKWNMSKTTIAIARNSLFKYLINFINSKNNKKNNSNNKLKIIYTGTIQDKINDPMIRTKNDYDCLQVDDLRGTTNIRETFILASLMQVKYYIGFDTFWLHLFNLYDKECCIMLKPGFNAIYNAQVKRYVAVPYVDIDAQNHINNNIISNRITFL